MPGEPVIDLPLTEQPENPTIPPSTTSEKVEFSEAQQRILDNAIKAASARAGKSAREEAARLKLENERLQALAVGNSPDASEVEKLRASIADERLRAQAAEDRAAMLAKTTYQQTLAAKFNHVDPDTSTKLLQNHLKFDAELKTFVAVDDAGVTRLNADGTPMTGEKLYDEFSNAKPWLVKSNVIFGTGSTGSWASSKPISADPPLELLFGPKSDGKLINQIAIKDNARFQILRAAAKRKGLI